MPPITILDYQPDGTGGWLIHWRDEANLEGPVEAFIHATADRIAELNDVRRQLHAPLTDMAVSELTVRADQQRGTTPDVPEGTVPYAVRDFIDGYAVHLTDCIDRHRLGVKGGAPHAVLEAARQGGDVPERFRTSKASKLDEFARQRAGASE